MTKPLHTDEQYRSFLDALDAAWDVVNITDWETGFLDDNVDRMKFTPAQRDVVEVMILKYGEMVLW
jgi:hypothetical protein